MNTDKTAVIIEDDNTIFYLLKQILKNNGIHSFPANSIREGLELIYDQHPDFIFIDNELPDGLGFDAISGMHQEGPGTQIIAMTARNNHNIKNKALGAGASYFLEKPFTIEQVNKSLKS
jgi:two-component system response regulator PilR (NtrC family)/two-component system KDP operon response regulator KdpE